MRYQHATKDRDRAIAEKLGALMSAAKVSAPVEDVVVPLSGQQP
jgi:hypothetical protein